MHRVLRIAEPTLDEQTRTGKFDITLRLRRLVGVIIRHIKTKNAAQFPSAESLLDKAQSLVNLCYLHAECIKLIFELDNKLLEHSDILLAGLRHIDDCECAGKSRSQLVTGRGLLAFVRSIRIT